MFLSLSVFSLMKYDFCIYFTEIIWYFSVTRYKRPACDALLLFILSFLLFFFLSDIRAAGGSLDHFVAWHRPLTKSKPHITKLVREGTKCLYVICVCTASRAAAASLDSRRQKIYLFQHSTFLLHPTL